MTLTELKTQVLQHLGVLATSTNPNADDAAIVATKYAALYEMLLTKDLVSWAVDDDVPDEAGQPIIMMLSYLCAPTFGIVGADYDRLRGEGALDIKPISLAEKQLRIQNVQKYVSSSAQPDYF